MRQVAPLSIGAWLLEAKQLFAFNDNSDCWEAMRLLAYVLNYSPVQIYQKLDERLTLAQMTQLQALLKRRQNGEPLAYIIGEQWFWTLPLFIDSSVLIPRSETELLVETVLALLDEAPRWCADLGTGSGAIALAIASERPAWSIVASDCSLAALQVAQRNARRHQLANVQFFLGHWFEALPPTMQFEVVVSNPPYVDRYDPALASEVACYEPQEALYASHAGLGALMDIVAKAPGWLKDGGWLLLEHGFKQAACVQKLLKSAGFGSIETKLDNYGHTRLTLGQYKMHK